MACSRQSLVRCCLALFLVVAVSGCGTPKEPEDTFPDRYGGKGIYHQVKKGETLNSIARAYNMSADDLARANGMADKNVLQAGFWLYVPNATQPATPVITSSPPPDEAPPAQPPVNPNKRAGPIPAEAAFVWPVKGRVLANFGDETDGFHDYLGIKIEAAAGTRVVAAKSGQVVWISDGGMAGYGKVIAIRHSDGYTTTYGYCSELLPFDKGDWVKQGDPIALSGRSGAATVPSLYFQVTQGEKEIDPKSVLK